MPDTEFAEAGRAVTALRTGLRQRAELPAFRPLDITELVTGGHPSPRAGRWISLSIGVAAVGAAITLLMPQGLGEGPLPATPVQTSSPGVIPSGSPVVRGTWQPTSPPLLSPRRDAVKTWVDGSYLIVGGIDAAPCLSLEDVGDPECPAEPPALRDGARYDPVTDSWHSIADAPTGVLWPGATNYPVAVVGSTVYVVSVEDDRKVLAYDVTTDSWQSIPSPEGLGMLVAVGGLLVNLALDDDHPFRFDSYNPASQVWTSHDPDVIPPSDAAVGLVGGVGATDNSLVFAAPNASMRTTDTLWVALVDVTTEKVTDLGWTPVSNQRSEAVAVGELVGFPRGGWGADEPDSQAWFLDPDTQAWTNVDLPDEAHGLTWSIGPYRRDWYLTTDTAIALRGRLYDPVAQSWIGIPDLPVPDQDPIVIGGPDSILTCFGAENGTYTGGCSLLWLPTPTAMPSAEAPTPVPTPAEPDRQPAAVPPSQAPSEHGTSR